MVGWALGCETFVPCPLGVHGLSVSLIILAVRKCEPSCYVCSSSELLELNEVVNPWRLSL
jgi:hypothetical protein